MINLRSARMEKFLRPDSPLSQISANVAFPILTNHVVSLVTSGISRKASAAAIRSLHEKVSFPLFIYLNIKCTESF